MRSQVPQTGLVMTSASELVARVVSGLGSCYGDIRGSRVFDDRGLRVKLSSCRRCLAAECLSPAELVSALAPGVPEGRFACLLIYPATLDRCNSSACADECI